MLLTLSWVVAFEIYGSIISDSRDLRDLLVEHFNGAATLVSI